MKRRIACALTIALAAAGGRARAQDGPEAVKATGVRAGLAVVLGASGGATELALAEGGRMAVHGLALSDADVEAARRRIRARGLAGLATVERPLTIHPLPYTDNLVNLLVADLDALGKEAPPKEEILRAVAPAPNGAAYVKRGGAWEVWTKPRPEGTDEWTHWKSADAGGSRMSRDTTVKPSNAIQWMNGPTIGGGMAPILCDGRAYFCLNGYAGSRPEIRNLLLAFDAFSGGLIWKLETPMTLEEGSHSGSVRGCAGGGLLFVSEPGTGKAVALDGATGKTAVAFEKGPIAERRAAKVDKVVQLRDRRELAGPFLNRMVAGGRLVEAMGERLAAWDARTGSAAWEETLKDEWFGHVRCGEGKVFATVGGKEPFLDLDGFTHYEARRVLCFDLKTGRRLWRSDELGGLYLAQFIYGDGNLIGSTRLRLNKKSLRPGYPRPELIGLDAVGGKVLFRRREEEIKLQSPVSIGFEELGVYGDRFFVMGANGAYLFDARTGAPADPPFVISRPTIATCQRQVGTPNYVIGPSLWFTAIAKEQDPWCGWRAISRASCHSVHPPAYGMNFTSPMAQDYTSGEFFGGHVATAHRPWGEPLAQDRRLQTGGADAPPKPAGKPPEDEWPVYLGDRRRAASTPAKGPASLKPAWVSRVEDLPLAKLQGPVVESWKLSERSPRGLTAPVVAEGLLVVGDSEGHRVLAMDAKTGRRAWEFETGGRVVLPPTIHQGLCLASCQDGWLYALRAGDGKRVWRYLASYGPRLIQVCGQVEAASPAVGSPLVDGDLVWVVAGRHTSTDGSAILHALDLRSGRPAWIHPLTAADMPKAYKFEQCWIDLLQTDVHDRLMASMALTFDPTRREIAKVGNQGKSKGSRAGSGASEPGAYCCWRPAHVGARGGTTGWNSFRHDASREHMAFVQTPGGRGQGGQGDKIAVLGRDYYTVTRARVNGTLALARWTLDEQGRVSAKPEWEQLHDLTSQKARRRTEGTGVAAMIVAADRIYIACYDDKGAPVVDAFDRATGKLVDGVALPAGREVVNNGLAAAYGRLYVACADGAVLCFGP